MQWGMPNTRTNSSSDKSFNSASPEADLIPLSTVKELLKVQESSMKAILQAYMESNNKRIDSLIRDVQDLKTSLEFTQDQFQDTLSSSETKAKEIKEKLSTLSSKLTGIEAKCTDMANQVDDQENRSRRNNLCFEGIPEDATESWETTEQKLKNILSSNLQIDLNGTAIERAHRIGRKKRDALKPRPVVAKFPSFKTREEILKNKKRFQGTNIFVMEDFSERVRERRRELLPEMHKARKEGLIAFLRYDKLVTRPASQPQHKVPWNYPTLNR